MEEIINLLKTSKLKEVSKATGIPYDRMYKWVTTAARPKSEDYTRLLNYFNGNGTISTEELTQEMIEREHYNTMKELKDTLARENALLRKELLEARDEIDNLRNVKPKTHASSGQ